MSLSQNTTTRITFLAPTRDEHGAFAHQAGEVIHGELVARKHDFLLVRTAKGSYMYVDTSRRDLYSVEMHQA